jgi:hypothetical protein
LNNETVTRKIVIDRQAIQDTFNAQNKCGEYLGVEFAKSQDINSIINTIFFVFWPFFRKILSNMPLAERIQKIDPDLGATVIGAKL